MKGGWRDSKKAPVRIGKDQGVKPEIVESGTDKRKTNEKEMNLDLDFFGKGGNEIYVKIAQEQDGHKEKHGGGPNRSNATKPR